MFEIVQDIWSSNTFARNNSFAVSSYLCYVTYFQRCYTFDRAIYIQNLLSESNIQTTLIVLPFETENLVGNIYYTRIYSI